MPRVDGWPPRWLTPVPGGDVRRGDGPYACEFIETLCKVTKESIAGAAGSSLVLRPWQRAVIGDLLARRTDGHYRHRQALIGLARKNGKSALLSGLCLWGLVEGTPGSEVYAVAGTRDQARIVHGTARDMVRLEPELSGLLKVYRDAIEYTGTGSVFRVLSAEAPSLEGLNPNLVAFDEVHVQPDRALWDVMSLASGARIDPLMVGITTAGVRFDASGRDSLCYGLYEYGKRVASGEVTDPSFYMAWWEPARMDSDHRVPSTWRQANPGFGDLVAAEDFASSMLRTPEQEFRIKRCNQWVTSMAGWLPAGAWDKVTDPRPIPDGADVVLGFDGSHSGDSTALVVVQLGDVPHIDVAGHWEHPPHADKDWRVPIVDVEDAIRVACRRWRVLEIACDPFRWARTIEVLESERLPVVEFPQTPQRMTPATTRFYEAVVNGAVTHTGHPALARHVDNAVLKQDARGSRIYKEHRHSNRKIDLAVAAVMALHTVALIEPTSDADAVLAAM